MRSGVFQELLSLADRGFTELAVDAAGVIHQLDQLGTCRFGCRERVSLASVGFVRKISGKGRPRATEAQAPAFKCGGFVGETGKVFAGLHVSN